MIDETKTIRLFGTLPSQIAEHIGQTILDDKLKPGEKLREVELATAYGVSRPTIREALRLVEREGLVTISPQRGARVTELSVEELRDVFEIRAELVGLAAQRLARRVTPAIAAQLTALRRGLESTVEDPEAYARASRAMSEFLARAQGSARLADLILSFGRQTARYTRLALSLPERRRRSIRTWRRAVAALAAADAEAARRLTTELVLGTRETALRILAGQAASGGRHPRHRHGVRTGC